MNLPLRRWFIYWATAMVCTLNMIVSGTLSYAEAQPISHVDSSKQDRGNLRMFTEVSLRNAVVEFDPLILYKIVSAEEQHKGTRSSQTRYDIEIMVASNSKKLSLKQVWRWGMGWQTEGYHLAILRGNQIINCESFPADSENAAKSKFEQLNQIIMGYASKFMQHDAYVLAKKGKGEIVLFKVVSGDGKDAKRKYKIEIRDNLSGGKAGPRLISVPGRDTLSVGGHYFALLRDSLLNHSVSKLRETTEEEAPSLIELYRMRISHFKHNWYEGYANP